MMKNRIGPVVSCCIKNGLIYGNWEQLLLHDDWENHCIRAANKDANFQAVDSVCL